LRDRGTVPPLVDNPEAIRGARSGDMFAPATTPWLVAYEEELGQALHPGYARAAE